MYQLLCIIDFHDLKKNLMVYFCIEPIQRSVPKVMFSLTLSYNCVTGFHGNYIYQINYWKIWSEGPKCSDFHFLKVTLEQTKSRIKLKPGICQQGDNGSEFGYWWFEGRGCREDRILDILLIFFPYMTGVGWWWWGGVGLHVEYFYFMKEG